MGVPDGPGLRARSSPTSASVPSPFQPLYPHPSLHPRPVSHPLPHLYPPADLTNMRSAISLASALFAATTPAFAAYNLIKEYQGTNFFSGWEFYGNYDNLTNGAYLRVRLSLLEGGASERHRRCHLRRPGERDCIEAGIRERCGTRYHQGRRHERRAIQLQA